MQSTKKTKRPRARRKIHLNRKILAGERHQADRVTSSAADMTNPFATKTGWSGVDFNRRPEWQWLRERWKDRSIVRIMVTERGFILVHYEGYAKFFSDGARIDSLPRRPTVMLDRNGIVFGFRSDIPVWVTEEFLQQFAEECRTYMSKCGLRSDEDIKANNRGNHWYMVVGIDRQNKPVCLLSIVPPTTTEAVHRFLKRHSSTRSTGQKQTNYCAQAPLYHELCR